MVMELPGKSNYFHGSHLWALRRLSDREIAAITKKKSKEKSDDSDEGDFILCRSCGNVITTTNNRIERDGKHKHTFTNPKGYVFRIGCFASARGSLNQGEPTMEYTWFAGFSWCFTLCMRCFAHLGWFYQSGSENFYGLILDNIIESKKGGPRNGH